MAARTFTLAASCLALGLVAANAQQPADEPRNDAASGEDWTVTVIDLKYANADELAAVLSQILPPSVTVVPYYATNSLIIAGDRAVIGALVGDEEEGESPRAAAAATLARAR